MKKIYEQPVLMFCVITENILTLSYEGGDNLKDRPASWVE